MTATDANIGTQPQPAERAGKDGPRTELWVFRVEEGLGNACLLIFPDGSGAVVDWGTNRDEPLSKLLTLLLRASEPRLCVVVATHPHADHTLGLVKLLEAAVENGIQVDRLVYPTGVDGPRGGALRRARARARELGIPISAVNVSTLPENPPAPVLALGEVAGQTGLSWRVRVLAPDDTEVGSVEIRSQLKGATPGNPTSLVLQFAYLRDGVTLDRGRAILPGDATPATLKLARRRSDEYPELSLVNDALVIPHHGSKHNWVAWFEDVIRGFALVSAPSGREKHPSVEVLKQAVKVCGAGVESRLLCTSYAGACYASFVKGRPALAGAPGRMEACFGDIGVSLKFDTPPIAIAHDPAGPARRSYGHCGAR